MVLKIVKMYNGVEAVSATKLFEANQVMEAISFLIDFGVPYEIIYDHSNEIDKALINNEYIEIAIPLI